MTVPAPGQGMSDFLAQLASKLYTRGFTDGRRSLIDYGFGAPTEVAVLRYFREFCDSGELLKSIESALTKADA